MYIATYDIGTTAVKGVVLEKDGHMVAAADKNLTTYMKGEQKNRILRNGIRHFVQ